MKEYIGPNEPVESTLIKFQETIQKYKFMELNLLAKRKTLLEKVPEIKKSLESIGHVSEKKVKDVSLK